MFGNEKWKIHSSKNSIKINKADINKIVIFNNFSIGKKVSQYFIDLKSNDNKTKCFPFLITTDYLFKKYNDEVCNS